MFQISLLLRDHEGIEFASDSEAEAHARLIADQIAPERQPSPDEPPLFVSIVHQGGHEVGKVPVRNSKPLDFEKRNRSGEVD